MEHGPDVFQQQAVEVTDLRMRRNERRQRRAHRLDGMSQVGRKGVAVARGTRGGIGNATRGDNHLRTFLLAFETAPVDIADAEDLITQGHDLRHARIINDLHAVLVAIFQQRIGDVPRLATLGKDALAAFDVELHPGLFEETDGGAVIELGKSLSEKLRVGTHLRGELLGRPCVGDVAAPFARDTDFTARLVHLFDQQHTLAVARRRTCGHHARCPRPDDDHVVRPDFFFFDLFHTAAKIDNNSFFPEKFFLSLRPKKNRSKQIC